MSTKAEYRAMCPTGKCTYPTEIDARAALKKIHDRPERLQEKPVPRAVYRCKKCKRWHLTRQLSAI